jgi:hypothetical protein
MLTIPSDVQVYALTVTSIFVSSRFWAFLGYKLVARSLVSSRFRAIIGQACSAVFGCKFGSAG